MEVKSLLNGIGRGFCLGAMLALLLIALAAEGVQGQASTGGITFQNCEKLTAYKNIYWNLDMAAGVVTYALEDQIPDGSWSAFGYNKQNKAAMIPSDVVITTATSATDYDLSERAQCDGVGVGVCTDTTLGGTNDVTLISTVRKNGISKVTFSKPLKTRDSKDYDLSSSTGKSVQAIYASGFLDGNGAPNYHDASRDAGYVNSFYSITLGRTPALNCVPLLSDTALTTNTSTALAPAPAASTDVPPLPAGTPGCSITFGGRVRSFQVCREEAAGLTYRWNILGGNQVEVAASCHYDGWCGLGIGRKMVGSSAIVAFPTDKGVSISNYLLAGQDEDEVKPGTGALRVGPLAAEYVGGTLTMLFNLTLSASQYPVSAIIVGKGPAERDSGSGHIQEHDSFFQGSIAWQQGTVSLELHRGITQAHGVLMVVVWVLFFPAGVLAARYLHHLDPLWWHLHRAFQGAGFVLFAVALGLSLKAKALDGRYSTPHKALGVFLLVAVCLQVAAVVLRPKKTAKVRFAWNQYHHWLGRVALLLSIPTIYLGTKLFAGGAAFPAVYSVLWILVLLVFVCLEAWWRLRGPWSRGLKEPAALPQMVPAMSSAQHNGLELNGRTPNGQEQYQPYASSGGNEGRRF